MGGKHIQMFGSFTEPFQTKLSGLVTLTFEFSISKWGHGSPVPWSSFLPICGFLHPSVLHLGAGARQTDGQTTTINPMGRRYNKTPGWVFPQCAKAHGYFQTQWRVRYRGGHFAV